MTEWHVVVAELQVRSLLQDSWGELTHEDIYKPTTTVSAFFGNISLRMAELLVTLDDMAQDLRTELEKAAEDLPNDGIVAETLENDIHDGTPAPELHNREAVLQFLRTLGNDLDRPVDLASLAWAVQREFGQEVSKGWMGSRTFKALLLTAIPSARLDAGPPDTLLPSNFMHRVQSVKEAKFAGIPDTVLLLKRVDPQFPSIGHEEIVRTYESLSRALLLVSWPDSGPDMRLVNELTKAARDLSGETGRPLSRRPLNYVARALLFDGSLRPHVSAEDIAEVFGRLTMARLASITDITEEDRQSMIQWLSH